MGIAGVEPRQYMTTSLGGMVQQGLDNGRMMMDARRVVASSGIVVASTAGLTRSMSRFLLGKMMAVISKCVKWCVFRVCWTGLCSQLGVGHFGEDSGYLMIAWV
jgi:hypothetical protein